MKNYFLILKLILLFLLSIYSFSSINSQSSISSTESEECTETIIINNVPLKVDCLLFDRLVVTVAVISVVGISSFYIAKALKKRREKRRNKKEAIKEAADKAYSIINSSNDDELNELDDRKMSNLLFSLHLPRTKKRKKIKKDEIIQKNLKYRDAILQLYNCLPCSKLQELLNTKVNAEPYGGKKIQFKTRWYDWTYEKLTLKQKGRFNRIIKICQNKWILSNFPKYYKHKTGAKEVSFDKKNGRPDLYAVLKENNKEIARTDRFCDDCDPTKKPFLNFSFKKLPHIHNSGKFQIIIYDYDRKNKDEIVAIFDNVQELLEKKEINGKRHFGETLRNTKLKLVQANR